MKGTPPSTTTKRLVSACFTEVMGFYEHTSAWELAPHLGLAGGPNFRWQYKRYTTLPIRSRKGFILL